MKAKRGRPKVKETAVVKKAAEDVRVITAVDPQALLAQAIAQGLPEVSMRELFAMRREMEAERSKKAYFNALSGFQHECPVIEKQKKVKGKKKEGETEAKTKYVYAPIEDIVAQLKELLEKWGFSFTFKSKQDDGFYTAICVAHHKDGHEESTEFKVPTTFPEYMNMSGPQMQGAACTYADRYAFKNAFGIVTKGDDTDGQPDEESTKGYGRRAPIQQPREKGEPVPVAHEELKPLDDYGKIISLLKSVSTAPAGQVVAIFMEAEQTDYTHEAMMNKNNPDELKRILSDIVATGAKRHKAIKGTDVKEAT